jgi:hypothetical protein
MLERKEVSSIIKRKTCLIYNIFLPKGYRSDSVLILDHSIFIRVVVLSNERTYLSFKYDDAVIESVGL